MKKTIFLLISIVFFTSLLVGYYLIFTIPKHIEPRQTVTLWVPPGSSSSRIATQLGQSGILIHPIPLKALVKILKTEKQLKPGEYNFEVPSSTWEVYQKLLKGDVTVHRVTFPEGLTAKESLNMLSMALGVNTKILSSTLKDDALRQRLGVPSPRFEGFLFPDTYKFTKTQPPEKMIEIMVTRFFEHISQENLNKARNLKMNLLQWITLASIIEKESGVMKEHPIIASVFHNRLAKKMRLQSDPTVIYGIPNFNGNLTKKNLQKPTPYNTYTQNGLPPGPICNPGASAIKAAVNPAKTNYLYFVATGNGEHVFSEDYKTHLKYVAMYQLKR
ncbi:MAG: endolytic transglycosylase MltG [Bdellovibrionales bacterium]|nr:endolytic transglycosylase MltG [Bdellovibrionales bacterium]